MRIQAGTATSSVGGLSPTMVLLSSIVFLLAAAMQLATTWLQMKNRAIQCSAESSASAVGSSSSDNSNWEKEYTWLGDDYPHTLPIDLGSPVAMTIEDSRHYSVNLPDAKYEWHSIYPGENLGFVRLGPKKRFFSLSLYHQVHCLETLRQAIVGDDHHHRRREDSTHKFGKRDSAHWAHCLNYLRQTILCNPDLTLEPEIEEGLLDVGEGLHVTHVCKDWSKVHSFVSKNWDEWWESQMGNATKVDPPQT